ncbi:MAG: hypothetical protein M1365_12645 [Actinobacteria bacterium]|nr:hypothetical protein [Actinomycetota bacterium]
MEVGNGSRRPVWCLWKMEVGNRNWRSGSYATWAEDGTAKIYSPCQCGIMDL